MKVKNGKIAEATEAELFEVYVNRGFDDIMSFTDYKRRCVELGTVVVEEGGE
jgi:hypothetical protein